MYKIELPNGVTIHCENVEEFVAALPLVQPGDPAPAPRLTAEEEAVKPGDTLPLFVKDSVTSAPAVPEPPAKPEPPVARRKTALDRIGPVYYTAKQKIVVDLLRDQPAGMSTRDMALIRHADELAPYADDEERHEEQVVVMIRMLSPYIAGAAKAGLVRKLPNSKVFVLSELGRITTPIEVGKPWLLNKHNKALQRYVTGLLAGDHE